MIVNGNEVDDNDTDGNDTADYDNKVDNNIKIRIFISILKFCIFARQHSSKVAHLTWSKQHTKTETEKWLTNKLHD